jgi:hypothetical protein
MASMNCVLPLSPAAPTSANIALGTCPVMLAPAHRFSAALNRGLGTMRSRNCSHSA